MSWLVTGGAGYVGAHLVHALHNAAVDIVVLDDLSTGDEKRLPSGTPFVQGSVLSTDALDGIFDSHSIRGVVHLAAKKQVDESIAHPSLYFHENVEGLRRLLDRCVIAGVQNFVFSSSAAVYGSTGARPVDEMAPCAPANPYGQTKLAGEWLTRAIAMASGLRAMALRYFNVAGASTPELADRDGMNLVPRIVRALSAGEAPVIYGDDFPTPDGSCIRDFVHVADVADAHLTAVQMLDEGDVRGFEALNIGTGRGASVREVIDVALEAANQRIAPVVESRRVGDPASVVGSVKRATKILNWNAQHDINDIVRSAWLAQRSFQEDA